MIRHLLRLSWRRKRQHALVIVEIFLSFLVVFTVLSIGVSLWANASRPLGFDWDDVWAVRIDMQQATDDEWTPQQVQALEHLLREVQAQDEVVSAAAALSAPYDFGKRSSGWEIDGKDVESEINEVTLEFAETLDVRIVDGRWFEEADASASDHPVVIDRDFATELFGTESAVGKTIPLWDDTSWRVIGVIEDFRRAGELSGRSNLVLELLPLGNPAHRPVRNIVVEIAPGSSAAFEQRLVSVLHAVEPSWSYEIAPLERSRASSRRLFLAPVIAGGIVAAFLLLMVALGLTGVLWQSVTRRTREIGLRRATGATASRIYRQVLGEIALIAAFGLLLGVIVVVQLPLLGFLGAASPGRFTGSVVASCFVVTGLALLCGLYPGWLAVRVQPAEALHHD